MAEIKNLILALLTMGQMGNVDHVQRKTFPVTAVFGFCGGLFADTWSQMLGIAGIGLCISLSIHMLEYFRHKSPDRQKPKSYIEMNDISGEKSKNKNIFKSE